PASGRVNPPGSTSRTCRSAGRVDSLKVIRVSLGIPRHMAARAAALAGIITPPGFTPLADGRAVARAAPAGLPGAAAPDPAVSVPATVLPQAASPITRPAAMPPSAARRAAPPGLPRVIITTPSAPRGLRAVTRGIARHGSHHAEPATAHHAEPPPLTPGGSAGPARPPRAGPAVLGRARAPVRRCPPRGCWCGPARLPQACPH